VKVTRKEIISTNAFELGDEIKFNLTTGEKIKAKAVKQVREGTLFITKDCIEKYYPMFKEYESDDYEPNDMKYENSDLRRYLNNSLIKMFPKKISKRMVSMDNGDLIRIPTVTEIFGGGLYGMRHHRNRVACREYNGIDNFVSYWLQDESHDTLNGDLGFFAIVDNQGDFSHDRADGYYGVRIVFCLSFA
jgi:hypothetical protein